MEKLQEFPGDKCLTEQYLYWKQNQIKIDQVY